MAELQLSVVVCTYNRAELLAICLETLANQDLPKEAYEILVVDNASTDATPEVAAAFVAMHENAHYVVEGTCGLSHARNRGWMEARGTHVGYVDDESKVPRTWLATAHRIVDARRPAVFGGPYAPWYATPKPRWFKDAYGSSKSHGATPRPLDAHEFLSGGNIFIRRDLLATLGGFDPEFGMRGRRQGYAEETAFQVQLRQRAPDAEVYYDPELLLYHLVRPEKMHLGAMTRARLLSGFDSGRVFSTGRPKTKSWILPLLWTAKELLTHASLFVWHSSLGSLVRDRTSYVFPQNHAYERALPHAHAIGALTWEMLRLARLPRASP